MPTKTNLKESQYNCHVSFEAKFKEDDEAYYVATIPLIEGIGEVTNWAGEKVKRLRLYENFAPYAHWLLGKPVTSNHERLGPETRKLGQMLDIKPKPEQRKVGATTKFFKKDITGAEAEKIASKKPFDGSIEVCCWWDHTPGSWMNPATGQLENYDVVEVGPYDFDAYSVVGKGVVPVEKGAGFNMESKKPHNHSAPGGADMEIEEMKQAIEEAQKPLMDRIAALEQSKTELQGKLDSMEQKAEADRSARVFEAFQAKLKPGHQEKAKEHFEAYQKDPAAWTLENSGMFIQAGRERQLSGRASTEGGPVGFNLEQERARLKAEGKVI